MKEDNVERERLLNQLNEMVFKSVDFFRKIDGDTYDGHQTAFEVLAHLVFWHRNYCKITQSLFAKREPKLLKGSLADLNEQAAQEFEGTAMSDLAFQLAGLQKKLTFNLRCLSDWDVNFPIKAGCRYSCVADRLCYITNHIEHHFKRQKRAYERGEAWVEAYYS